MRAVGASGARGLKGPGFIWGHKASRADEAEFVSDGRARVLSLVLPLFSALVLVNAWVISQQPGTRLGELMFFLGGSLVLATTALLFALRRVPYLAAATLLLLTIGSLLVVRILVLFLGGYFDVPGRSLYMPVYASLPVLYVMTFALLPLRRAERIAIGLWLPISLLITALSVPYWGRPDKHGSLVVLLANIWLGHGIYLILFSAVSRRQQALVDRYAASAEAERRARQAMVESEAQFRSVFDLAAVGMSVTDQHGRFLMVNQRLVDLLGYSREELLARDDSSVTLPADVDSNRALLQRLLSGGAEQDRLKKRYVRKDGERVHVELYVRRLGGAPGAPRMVAIVVDVTERHRAEEQAAEQRRLRDLHFEHSPLAVVEWDAGPRIRRWSPRAEQMFGWTEPEALGRTAEDLGLFPASEYGRRRQRVERILGGDERQRVVVPMLHRSGRKLWGDVYNFVVRDADGNVRTIVSMVQDITEAQDMLHMLNESEARFRGIFSQAAVGIALLDAAGRWLNVNQKLCEIVGYALDELLELDFRAITHPDDLERDTHLARAVMDRTIDQYSIEKRYVRKGGEIVWVMLFVRRLEGAAEEPARFVSVVEDISERKAAEERVQALTASLEAQVAERTAQLREVIRAGQRRNDELALITDMGRLLSASTDQIEAAQVVVRYLPRIFPLADGALYLEGRRRGLFERQVNWGDASPGAITFTVADCWALRGGEIHMVEGSADPLHCPHTDSDSHAHCHVCVPILNQDAPVGVIELAWGRTGEEWAPEMPLVKTVAETIGLAFGNLRLREELSRQALVDPLTGLHNRRWLERCLGERVARHARGGGGFAVLMIDVDRFKSINDRFGHDAGDRALQEIAQALLRSLRAHDAAARLGGEEFTVVIDTVDAAEAVSAAERVRQAVVALRVRTESHELPELTVSIGVALYPQHGEQIHLVLERADQALYDSKRNGRNQVSLPPPLRALT